jgi:hypothetical protein
VAQAGCLAGLEGLREPAVAVRMGSQVLRTQVAAELLRPTFSVLALLAAPASSSCAISMPIQQHFLAV